MEENNGNNDEEIRNILNELVENEDETTQKILNKENKKIKIKKEKTEKRTDIEPIITNAKLYIVTITILLSVISKEEVGLAIGAIGNMFIMVRAIAKIIENIMICLGKKGQRKRYIFLIILLLTEIVVNTITIVWIVSYYMQEVM